MNDDLVLFEIFFFWAMNPVTFFFLPFSTSVRNVSLNLNVERSFSWKRMQNPSQSTYKLHCEGNILGFLPLIFHLKYPDNFYIRETFRRNAHELRGFLIKVPYYSPILGKFNHYVRMFWGGFEPPANQCKDIFSA